MLLISIRKYSYHCVPISKYDKEHNYSNPKLTRMFFDGLLKYEIVIGYSIVRLIIFHIL
jgi:hypothetical protein